MLAAAALASSLLAAPVPEPPPAAEPAADPTADPAATEPATAEPPPSVDPATTAPAPAQAGPPPPRHRGLGLIITAGVVGGLGLGANLGRIGIIQAGCKAQATAGESINDCLRNLTGYFVLSIAAPFVNGAATGLAGAAGSTAGRYQAWNSAYGDKRERVAGAYIGSGAGLLGVGLILYLATRIKLFTDLYGAVGCEAKMDFSDACVRGRWSGWLAGITLGQSMVVTGTGLLSFGVSYSSTRPYYRTARMRVDPILAPTWTGLSLRGEF